MGHEVYISFELNGRQVSVISRANRSLLDLLRNDFKLTGLKEGCGEGECGVCTVVMDGETVNSCLVLAPQADGSRIMTIEGLSGEDDNLHPLQEAFLNTGAVQCGFCLPGMILSAKVLLDENQDPSEEEIKTSLSGNICRCTGYQKIIEAVQEAASHKRQGQEHE